MRRKAHEKDVCKCGDARSSHVLGRGACGVCRWEYQPLGYPCMRFRLARAHRQDSRQDSQHIDVGGVCINCGTLYPCNKNSVDFQQVIQS